MKKLIIIFTTLISLISCTQKPEIQADRSSILLIDNQIDLIIREISNFENRVIYYQDTTDIHILKKLRQRFDVIRAESKNNIDNDTIVNRVKKLYKECGLKYNFRTTTLLHDVDSLSYSTDKELKLAINELCLFSRISNAMMIEYSVSEFHRTECIKTAENEYNVYLIPKLNSYNSALNFGYYDGKIDSFIVESDSNITAKVINDHYTVKNNNPKTKHGYIKTARSDGTYAFYPFTMGK